MGLAYYWYETAHLMLSPARAATDATRLLFSKPVNPLTHTPYGRTVAAACELFERTTRRYGKPAFGYQTKHVDGQRVPVIERIVWERPFCDVISFDRRSMTRTQPQPKVLMVAPMSGHYATLLRGTVEAFLPTHQVFITDWADARLVPLSEGRFDLDDYIDYLISMFRALGPDLHVMAVCQPSVPVMAAIARMEAEDDPLTPRQHDPDGRPDRHPPLADGGQSARGGARRRVVPAQLHHQGAGVLSGLLARRLSWLPPALGLHGDEHGPPRHGPLGHVQASGQGRRRFGREASRVLRRISGGHGPDGRVLSPDRREGVRRTTNCPKAR